LALFDSIDFERTILSDFSKDFSIFNLICYECFIVLFYLLRKLVEREMLKRADNLKSIKINLLR